MYYYPYYFHAPYCSCNRNHSYQLQNRNRELPLRMDDQGGKPFVLNIEEAAERNTNFRTAIWTSKYLQVTLMSIEVDDDIGLEVHSNTDQFLRIEDGDGLVMMGNTKDDLPYTKSLSDDDAVMVPAGTWHNIKNIGNKPLKLYSIYAPPHHSFSTIENNKTDQ